MSTRDVRSRRYGLHIGVIVDRADPLIIGRVKVRVPGIIEPGAWALPLGFAGGGGAQQGFYNIPPVNAEVGIFFKEGDPDYPYYLPANWGTPGGVAETPGIVGSVASPEEAPRIKALETERWLLYLDDRPGLESFGIVDKVSGDGLRYEARGSAGEEGGFMTIKSRSYLEIKSDGNTIVNGLNILVGNRVVARGTKKPI